MTAKILIAEDSLTIRAMVKMVLEQGGFQVITASDGIEAVEKAYAEKPDVIVSDIMMPKMSGYQVSRLLKDDPATAYIPIMIMTTKQEESSKFWSLRTGADDYILKPFDPQDLLDRVSRLYKTRTFMDKLPSAALEKQTVDTSSIVSRVNTLLDLELFRSTLVNDVGSLTVYLQNFRQMEKAILELLAKVVNYQISGLFVSHEGTPSLVFLLREPQCREVLMEMEGKLIRAYERAAKTTVRDPDRISREIHGEVTEKREPSRGMPKLNSFYGFPLSSGTSVFALAGVASTAEQVFPPEDVSLLDFLKNHLSLVLDSALLHKKTAELAITDGLTGLSTHRYFQEALDRETGRSKRFNLTFSLIMLDIDNFKSLNDRFGHMEGDKVLVDIAKIAKQCVRETDVVARYGGEEFVVILSETAKEGAAVTAERIRKSVEQHNFLLDGRPVRVTVSIGYGNFPEDAHTKTDLVRLADKALYKSKTSGKNRVTQAEKEGGER